MARSRSPNLRMRSPRLRLRLAVPRYSVARDAHRGSLTLARTLDSLASPPAQLAKRSTPRVAGSLVPHLARNLTQYPGHVEPVPVTRARLGLFRAGYS